MDVTPLNTVPPPVVTLVPAAISAEEPAGHRQLIQAIRAVNPELYGQDNVATNAVTNTVTNAVTVVLDQTRQSLPQIVNRKTKEVIRPIPGCHLRPRCAQCDAVSGLKRMTRRDRRLAVLLAGAMLGPWHTANRLSRLRAATGGCPDQGLTARVLFGGITARTLREGIAARTALRDKHYGAILATINDSESDAIDPPDW